MDICVITVYHSRAFEGWQVELHYPVAKHKTPLRRRTLGRLARVCMDGVRFFGLPRFFGGIQRGGAI